MSESDKKIEVAETEIASHWIEEELIHPKESFVVQADMSDPNVIDRFSSDKFPDSYRD